MENDVWPDKLSDVYASYISMGKIIVLFWHRVISNQYIQKKHKWFGIKTYMICHFKCYRYSMTVYLGKDRKCVPVAVTATHSTVKGFTARVENKACDM